MSASANLLKKTVARWRALWRRSWPPSWPRLGHLNLRPKLILAFVAIAAMAALCGVVGLIYVNRITATVSAFTDVTSPLLTNSVSLVEHAQRTRSLVFSAIEQGKEAGQFSRELSEIHQDIQEHVQALKFLSGVAKIDLHLEEIEQYEKAFFATLTAIIEASSRERSAGATALDWHATFDSNYRQLRQVLIALADRTDGKMMQSEDEAKVQVQTRMATVDDLGDRISDIVNGTYPVVQNANKLLHELEQVEDTVRWLLRATPDQLPAIEEAFKRSFGTMALISRKLQSRLVDSEGRVAADILGYDLAELNYTILGNGALFYNQRAVAVAKADIAAGRRSFDKIEGAYFTVLNNVEDAVKSLNQSAKEKTAAEITQARAMTSISAVITIIAGALFSLFFAHRLTAPLVRLTDQVKNVRTSGELKVLPDASVARRNDEIGILSRSFNLMIGNLAEARQQLIAQSEAEINQQYERLNLAINSMPQGLCMFDADQKLIISNKPYAKMYGLKPEQAAQRTTLRALLKLREATLNEVDRAKNVFEDQLHAVESGKPWFYVRELNDGRTIAISHLPVPGGGSIATHEDITEHRRVEAKIAYMAHHDMLTGLPNRVAFRDEMQHAMEHLGERAMAALCLDLDYFKNVNDTLGHPVGDALLKSVALRLRSCLRPSDKVARLGGDEFAVIQIGVAQPEGSTALASRLIKEITEPFMVEGHQVVIGASIGISLAPADGQNPDLLMKNADMALYRAKEDGRGTYRYFEPGMDARMQARRRLELDLRKALALGQFELFYQPLINIKSGEVSACEALMRWRHPERGLISPGEFIPLAEEMGFINQLGAWALRTACAEAIRWPEPVKLSVNLSPVQFKSGTLVSDVTAALDASGLSPNRLELEITESVLLNETDATLLTLEQLHDLGAHISMDDFGTGYSSLGYLRKFPFDKIKIDQSFIRDLADKPDSIAIIRAVAGLANTLGITTTAEGVETEAQLLQIKNEGCIEAQGYLFSRPIASETLLQMLQQSSVGAKAVA